MRRFWHRLCFICIALMAWASVAVPVTHARADAQKVLVRVGFPIQENITEKTEAGGYTGYNVDYLNELKKYTNWEYEFVEVEGDINTQIVTLMEMLEAGEIDILGTMNYSEALEQVFLYPNFSYGLSSTALAVRADDMRWMSGDYQNWSGIRVAIYPAQAKRLEQLQKLAEVNGFTVQTVSCENGEKTLQAVIDGEADAMLFTDIAITDTFRSLANFNPTPFYFAVSKHRPDLVRMMNNGMESLLKAYPSLQSELYTRYFSTENAFFLSDEDRAWMESLDPLRVLFLDGNAPIQFVDHGEVKGVARSFLDRLSAATGHRYEIVVSQSYDEALQKLKSGEANAVAAVPGEALLVSDASLSLSVPYFESRKLMVRGSRNSDMRDLIDQIKINGKKALDTLQRSPEATMYLDAYIASFYMRKDGLYDRLELEWTDTTNIMYAMGFNDDFPDRFMNIINAFADSLSQDDKQNMLYDNSSVELRYTFREWTYVHQSELMVMLLGVFVACYLAWLSSRNRKMRQTLTNAERLRKFSLLMDECLFEYSYRTDCLILQNGEALFANHSVVEHFLYGEAGVSEWEEPHQLAAAQLREILEKREQEKEFSITTGEVARWYQTNMDFVEEDYVVGRIADISKERLERHELEQRATTDPLTGLTNRRALEMEVNTWLAENPGQGLYMLMDLDNFKLVNDNLGHDEGDRVLCAFADYLRGKAGGGDLQARIGGDEFVVFIREPVDKMRLERKLEDLIQGLKREVFARYQQWGLSMSIGAAYATASCGKAEDLYRIADDAMYAAKFSGKSRFTIYDGSEQDASCRVRRGAGSAKRE